MNYEKATEKTVAFFMLIKSEIAKNKFENRETFVHNSQQI